MQIKDMISNIDELVKLRDGLKNNESNQSCSIIKKQKNRSNMAKRFNRNKKENILSKREKKYEDATVKITINRNLCSCNIKNLKFSNYLRGDNGDRECQAVRNILKLNNKKITNDEIPFTVDEDRLTRKKRHNKIMKKMDLKTPKNINIQKSRYRDNVCRKLGMLNDSKEYIRVYYIDRSDEIRQFEVILIDIYHLFATTIYDNYEKVRKYKYDMKNFITEDQ